MESPKHLQLIIDEVWFEVENESDWHKVKDVQVWFLTVRFKVKEKLVFRCNAFVALNVIDQLFIAILTQLVVLDTIGKRLPFEIE